MNNSLSPEIRSRAMWCHLSGLTWLFLKLIGLLFFYVFSLLQLRDPFLGSLLMLWPGVDLILPFLVPSAVWLLNRRIHPFVDLAGKATLNVLLTMTVQISSLVLLGIFMLLTTCGMMSKGVSSATTNGLLVTFSLIVALPILLILLTHIATTIYAAFRAQKGEVYSYPMTIKFFK
jgi:uncharacterized Tic20 family protein